MATWTLRIDQPSPSGNKFAYSHWRTRHASKNEWLMLIRAAPGFNEIPKATGKRVVVLTRYGKRQLDPDNIAGGAKGIIDCLKHWSLIVDDSPDFISVIFDNGKLEPGDPEHTIIEISEIGNQYGSAGFVHSRKEIGTQLPHICGLSSEIATARLAVKVLVKDIELSKVVLARWGSVLAHHGNCSVCKLTAFTSGSDIVFLLPHFLMPPGEVQNNEASPLFIGMIVMYPVCYKCFVQCGGES